MLRHRPQPLAQHKVLPRPSLLQTHHHVLQSVGPEYLGDVSYRTPSSDAAEALQAPEGALTLPVAGEHLAHAEQVVGVASEPFAATQRGIAVPEVVQSSAKRPPEQSMHLLDTQKAGSKDPISVRLEHAWAEADHAMKLFAAGARAAIENVAPAQAASWWNADSVANRSTGATAPAQASVGSSSPPGAMSFFSSSARVGAANPNEPRGGGVSMAQGRVESSVEAEVPTAKPASMLVGAATASADATAAHVDVLPQDRGPSTLEEQRQALALSERLQEIRVADLARAQDLERQSSLEDAMNRVSENSGWS